MDESELEWEAEESLTVGGGLPPSNTHGATSRSGRKPQQFSSRTGPSPAAPAPPPQEPTGWLPREESINSPPCSVSRGGGLLGRLSWGLAAPARTANDPGKPLAFQGGPSLQLWGSPPPPQDWRLLDLWGVGGWGLPEDPPPPPSVRKHPQATGGWGRGVWSQTCGCIDQRSLSCGRGRRRAVATFGASFVTWRRPRALPPHPGQPFSQPEAPPGALPRARTHLAGGTGAGPVHAGLPEPAARLPRPQTQRAARAARVLQGPMQTAASLPFPRLAPPPPRPPRLASWLFVSAGRSAFWGM